MACLAWFVVRSLDRACIESVLPEYKETRSKKGTKTSKLRIETIKVVSNSSQESRGQDN